MGQNGIQSSAVVKATRLDGSATRIVHGPIANSHVGVGAVSADGVYVTTASEVSLLPKAGGTPKVIASGQAYPLRVIANEGEVFWLVSGYNNGEVPTGIQAGAVMRLSIESPAEGTWDV